jgi:hypothetical protein
LCVLHLRVAGSLSGLQKQKGLHDFSWFKFDSFLGKIGELLASSSSAPLQSHLPRTRSSPAKTTNYAPRVATPEKNRNIFFGVMVLMLTQVESKKMVESGLEQELSCSEINLQELLIGSLMTFLLWRVLRWGVKSACKKFQCANTDVEVSSDEFAKLVKVMTTMWAGLGFVLTLCGAIALTHVGSNELTNATNWWCYVNSTMLILEVVTTKLWGMKQWRSQQKALQTKMRNRRVK